METKNNAGSLSADDELDEAPILTDAEVGEVEEFQGNAFVRRGRGRPPTGNAKELVSVRLDRDVVATLRAAGPGWQTQVNTLLRQSLGLDRDKPVQDDLPNTHREIVAAVYDTVAHAEQAVRDLLASNVPQSAIHLAQGSCATGAVIATTRVTGRLGGFWSTLFGGSSDTPSVYDRTLESGGNVVSVTTVPDHDYEAVMAILERHNPVDIDEWVATCSSTMTTGTPMNSGTVGSAYADATTAEAGGVIQLVPEELAVGKRLVNRGGTRVRRYLVETPIEESVTVRQEKVDSGAPPGDRR